MDNLKRMLQQKGLQLLDLAWPSYLPGHLVKIHYFWRFGDIGPETQLLEDRGLATSILNIPAVALSPRVPSDFVLENVTDQFQISAGAGLPQFGLAGNADVQKGRCDNVEYFCGGNGLVWPSGYTDLFPDRTAKSKAVRKL
jgi:hypothetical protein